MLRRITFVLSFIAVTVLASPPDAEVRTHYLIASRGHTPIYFVTTITSASEMLGSETYLIEGATGQRILISIRRNYASHLFTADYAVNDAKPVRVTLQMPGKGATRSESLSEYRQHPELHNEDVVVTINAGGKVLKTAQKEWNDAASGVRDKARLMAGSEFVAAMKPLGRFLGFAPFGGACSTYQFVADGAQCGMSSSVMFAIVRPDCDFDAKFGKPCDSTQVVRAKQQPKDRKVGSY